MPKLEKKLRVAIVGAGATGMAAAFSFSLDPNKFEVKVLESASYCGGMATSVEIDSVSRREELHGIGYPVHQISRVNKAND